MVIAAVVQFTKMFIEKTSPLLYRVLGVFLPLITTNCAVLGVALQNAAKPLSFAHASLYGFGAGLVSLWYLFYFLQCVRDWRQPIYLNLLRVQL
jgi:electron transport complex protein RnfA